MADLPSKDHIKLFVWETYHESRHSDHELIWLSSDEDLISIRPKPPEDRKVNMTAAQFGRVRLSSQFLLPGALLLAGLSVWWRRR